MKSAAATALIALAWGVALVAVPELALRVLGERPEPEPAVGNRRFVEWLGEQSLAKRNPDLLYEPDRALLWKLVPGARVETWNFHYDPRAGERQPATITINREGNRGPLESPATGASPRVLCMGDSNFFGYPLDDAFAFPATLERALQRAGMAEAEVINGATPGYSVLQGWRWYEQRFADYPYDVLLLSYLNNDAWPQPQSDLEAFDAQSSVWSPALAIADRLWLVRWLRARRDATPEDEFVPRVALADFEAYYRRFIDRARSRGAMVVLVDHRAYPEYAPYTEVLRRLAEAPGVSWLPVGHTLSTEFSEDTPAEYPLLARRVEKRWGADKLGRRPYLWYYAEMYPEHLNELGNELIAETLAKAIAAWRSRHRAS